GPRIIQFVAKTIIAHLDWGMNIQEAISSPNFVTLRDVLELENGLELEKIKLELEKMGHKVTQKNITSGINAITIDKNSLNGGADPRRGGAATGN
ncbi:MAG: gamma-glutamyltransferase, partial [Proteobacteria bacterium]|nr:gamma-glutamyltransferase [Pseudomonadota bacterium]